MLIRDSDEEFMQITQSHNGFKETSADIDKAAVYVAGLLKQGFRR
jgi:hypothetical protein